jgi:DNA invertase Pin-like site-specific DNA recombinase
VGGRVGYEHPRFGRHNAELKVENMPRKSSRDISAQPESRIDTSSVTEDGWGNNSSSSRFWPVLDRAYIKDRYRSPKPEQHRPQLKNAVQYLNRVDTSPFEFVGAAAALFTLWTLADPSMMDNISILMGTALLLGTVTLSRFGGGRDDEGNDASDADDTTTEDTGPDWAGGTGVRYIRVSSLGQKEGYSLETQLDTLKSVANGHDIDLPFSHIRDEGRTGTNFDREGIEEVLTLAKNGEIDTLLVANLSRIGRKAPETIFFIYILYEYWDVTVVTPNGPRRLNTSKELMTTVLLALVDHLSSMNRTRQAVQSTIRRFKDGNWSSAYKDNIPFGYRPTEDGWITKVDQMEDVVQDLFDHFLNSGNYTATGEYMSNKYGMDSLEDNSGKVKKLLTRSVYIGKPRMNIKSDKVAEDEVVVDDPALEIVDERYFPTDVIGEIESPH